MCSPGRSRPGRPSARRWPGSWWRSTAWPYCRPAPMALPTAELGESACWDPATGNFYWIDSPAGLVHRLDGRGEHACWDIGQSVGVVRPRAGGDLAVGGGDGFLALDP